MVQVRSRGMGCPALSVMVCEAVRVVVIGVGGSGECLLAGDDGAIL